MLTFPVPRKQGDNKGDAYSLETAIDFNGLEDLARQEFRDEADVNVMMKKFGAFGPNRAPIYGETDYNQDLQQTLGAIAATKEAHSRLPAALREKYPTWVSLMAAVEQGTFEYPPEETPATPVTPET